MRYWIMFVVAGLSCQAMALGNHPQSSVCTADKPYQAICTHSLHSLDGWYGKCFATEEEAQKDADLHAQQEHGGNSRWTGINKAKLKNPSGY
jgi:hypothetical protein